MVDDLVTVILSVRVVAAAVLLPRPRNKETSNRIKRTPPTTHTHGAAYQSVEFVTVTVLLVLLVPELELRAAVVLSKHSGLKQGKH